MATVTKSKVEIVGGLQQHSKQLGEFLDELKGLSESAKQIGPVNARGVAVMLWNEAANDGSMDDPARKLALQTQLAWARDVEQSQAETENLAGSVSNRYCDTVGKFPKSLERQPKETLVTRFERSLVGLGDNLLATAPRSVKKVGKGALQIDWTTPDRQGAVSWTVESDPQETTYMFVPMAQASVELYGDVDTAAAQSITTFFVEDLRRLELELPLFQLDKDDSDESRTVLRWRREKAKEVLLDFEPSAEELEWARNFPLPSDVELTLWDRYPALALVLDRALCYAAVCESELQRSGDRPPSDFFGMEQLVDELIKVSGRDRSEVNLLLTPINQWFRSGAPTDSEEAMALDSLLESLKEQAEG